MNKTALEEAVTEAFENALEGGYREFLIETDAILVAMDMMDCDSEVERLSDGDIYAVADIVEILQQVEGEE